MWLFLVLIIYMREVCYAIYYTLRHMLMVHLCFF